MGRDEREREIRIIWVMKEEGVGSGQNRERYLHEAMSDNWDG